MFEDKRVGNGNLSPNALIHCSHIRLVHCTPHTTPTTHTDNYCVGHKYTILFLPATCAHSHTLPHTHICTCTHACRHTHKHTHTHTHSTHTHTGHAFLGQGGGVVDGDIMQLWMRSPVLVQDQQQLLRTAERKHRNQTSTTSGNYVVNSS